MRLPPPEAMLIPLAATRLDLAYVADVRCVIDADHRDQRRDLFYLHCAAATRGGSDLPRVDLSGLVSRHASSLRHSGSPYSRAPAVTLVYSATALSYSRRLP